MTSIMGYILRWLGLTTSSVFHVDLDSQHWLWYHNIISIVYWLGLTTLISMSCDTYYNDLDSQHHQYLFHVVLNSQHWNVIYFMLTRTINIVSISCWLGLKMIIVISCDIFYVDWGSQHHQYFMLTQTHNIDCDFMWFILCWLELTTSSVFHVDSDSKHWL